MILDKNIILAIIFKLIENIDLPNNQNNTFFNSYTVCGYSEDKFRNVRFRYYFRKMLFRWRNVEKKMILYW